MFDHTCFSDDYQTARQRFINAAEVSGWSLDSHATGLLDRSGRPIFVDVACFQPTQPARLVITSGLHGVEGYLGSAVQLSLLQRFRKAECSVGCVLVHAINPYGFAWNRRTDERNVDLNRNFLLDGEAYRGCPTQYHELNSFLNPERLPSRVELFWPQAIGHILRRGIPALKSAIASGQYVYPRGLFFGGSRLAEAARRLESILAVKLAACQRAFHLDIHSGLGRTAECQLLFDYQPAAKNIEQLQASFGKKNCRFPRTNATAYQAQGSLGRWCRNKQFADSYEYACVEFGTYQSIKVLRGLMQENRMVHAVGATHARTVDAGRKLKELFCPNKETWRKQVLAQAVHVAEQAIAYLQSANH